jgi:DNA-binding XRE family transcriptional regulator
MPTLPRQSDTRKTHGAYPVTITTRGGPSVPRDRSHRRDTDTHPTYLVRDETATHVVVPVDEYERLVKAEMALQAIAQIENEKDEDFVDADDLAIELATESVVKARKAAGLTQAQLAKKLGMPQSQISRIERNPDRTTVRTLKKIAKALRVDVRAFV